MFLLNLHNPKNRPLDPKERRCPVLQAAPPAGTIVSRSRWMVCSCGATRSLMSSICSRACAPCRRGGCRGGRFRLLSSKDERPALPSLPNPLHEPHGTRHKWRDRVPPPRPMPSRTHHPTLSRGLFNPAANPLHISDPHLEKGRPSLGDGCEGGLALPFEWANLANQPICPLSQLPQPTGPVTASAPNRFASPLPPPCQRSHCLANHF